MLCHEALTHPPPRSSPRDDLGVTIVQDVSPSLSYQRVRKSFRPCAYRNRYYYCLLQSIGTLRYDETDACQNGPLDAAILHHGTSTLDARIILRADSFRDTSRQVFVVACGISHGALGAVELLYLRP